MGGLTGLSGACLDTACESSRAEARARSGRVSSDRRVGASSGQSRVSSMQETKGLAGEDLVDLRTVKRLALIVMALFPALWGLLGDVNNATDFTDTVNSAVRPMIEMTNTYGNPWQTWRAITAPWAAPIGLLVIMLLETSAGVFGAIAVVVMLINIRASPARFAKGKA